MGNLYTKSADSVKYDNLFAGGLQVADVQIKSVNLKADQGVLKRGTVLGITTSNGTAVIVNSANVDGSQTANCILTDDVDTTGAAVVATAYSSGTFNRKALIVGGTDTVEQHETRLRELGIYLKENIAY